MAGLCGHCSEQLGTVKPKGVFVSDSFNVIKTVIQADRITWICI